MRFLCDEKRKDDAKYAIRSVERIFEFEERNNENGENTSEATVLLHSRHDYTSSTTVSFFLSPPPLFSSFLSILHRYALPQQPSSLWGTHYRCFFHVISEPHTPFRATLHTRRLSICGPTWIVYFLSFFCFASFCFLTPFNSLSICFATCRNIVGLFRIFDLRQNFY